MFKVLHRAAYRTDLIWQSALYDGLSLQLQVSVVKVKNNPKQDPKALSPQKSADGKSNQKKK